MVALPLIDSVSLHFSLARPDGRLDGRRRICSRPVHVVRRQTNGRLSRLWVVSSLCNLYDLCASVLSVCHVRSTTETQRTQRLHREILRSDRNTLCRSS